MTMFDPFAPATFSEVAIDVYTDSARVSGVTRTRFQRVGDIVNQLPTQHLTMENATITEHGESAAPTSAAQVLVDVGRILFVVTTGEPVAGRAEMRIAKRAAQVELVLPPFRVSGSVHIPPGSRPTDGLLNAADRFLVMTDASIASARHPALAASVPALAVQRAMAQLIVVGDDEQPDELLADVLDETTAQDWLQREAPQA